jgi:hypothetical protein
VTTTHAGKCRMSGGTAPDSATTERAPPGPASREPAGYKLISKLFGCRARLPVPQTLSRGVLPSPPAYRSQRASVPWSTPSFRASSDIGISIAYRCETKRSPICFRLGARVVSEKPNDLCQCRCRASLLATGRTLGVGSKMPGDCLQLLSGSSLRLRRWSPKLLRTRG